jgi:uncharacterized membrane protein YfcA
MSDIGLIVYAVVSFFMSIIGSIAGGGSGFVTTPLLIFLGLSPAQAIATGKCGGLSTTVGSLVGMKDVKIRDKATLVEILIIAGIVGLVSPLVIVNIDGELYQIVIGIFLVVFSPIIYYKKVGHISKDTSPQSKAIGTFGLVFALFMQGIFSSGLGVLVNFVLMKFFGFNALDTNIIKRTSQLLLNVLIVGGLLLSGLIVWRVAMVAVLVNFFGSYIGGKIAVNNGAAFVSLILSVLAFMSGVGLLLS